MSWQAMFPDLIKWFDDAIAISRHGRGVLLQWPWPQPPGREVERILRRYGIKAYARQYAYKAGDLYGVTVRAEQAKWAAYVLGRAGVPIVAPAWASNAAQPGAMPPAWGVPAKPVGFAGWVIDGLLGPEKRRAR